MLDFIGGLLDNPARGVGIDPEQIDPNQRWALRGMTLQALANQFSGGTPFYQGMQSIAQGVQDREAAELKRQQQLAAMQQQQQLQALFAQDPVAAAQAGATQAAMGAPTAQAGPVGPTLQRGAIQQALQGQINPNKAKADQYRKAAAMVAATSPETADKYIAIADRLDPREEFYAPTEAGGQFFQASKTGQVRGVEGFAPKGPALPSSVQEFQYGQQDPAFNQWLQQQNRAKGTSLTVNTGEKRFVDALAPAIAQQVAGSAEAAASARSTLGTVAQIKAALPSAITGPGADARIFLTRLQSTLGVGGNTDQERLANTQRVLQGLAQTQLNAAEQMAGQGAITDFERGLIAQTAGGNISMTPGEITAALDAVEKVARQRVQSFERNVQNLQSIPGMQPLMPFFAGQGGAPLPQAGAPASIQDAAKAEIERRQRGGR